MSKLIQVDIVSQEAKVYSSFAAKVFLEGIMGELGIYPGHSPLLTTIKPCTVDIVNDKSVHEYYCVYGGILEVQPYILTILADTVERGEEIDEESALKAKQEAELIIKTKSSDDIDVIAASAQLRIALAKLATVRRTRGKM